MSEETFNIEKIKEIIKKVVPQEQLKDCEVYFNYEIREINELIQMGGSQKIQMPFKGFIAFIDLMPGANYAHDVIYLMINCDTFEYATHKGKLFPPNEKWKLFNK